MEKKIVTFGEVMLRLSPPGNLRFSQATSLDVQYGGGEANVCASLANFGENVEYVTRLPENDLGMACLQQLKRFGIGTKHILWGGNRLGIYFLETGSSVRGSKVVYDRDNSSFSSIPSGSIQWETVFADAEWFHVTGISPAVSKSSADVCLEALVVAKQMGVPISCDLNYRGKLWKWTDQVSEIMSKIVGYCDCIIGNEEDAEKYFGIKAHGSDITKGEVATEGYQMVCSELVKKFPNLSQIAITLRGSLSASHNTWSAIFWEKGKFFTGKKLDIVPITDRVGGGDSFAAGLIYGLRHYPDPQTALDFAICASGLKHTIFGDFNLVTVDEVTKLMKGDASGRVSR